MGASVARFFMGNTAEEYDVGSLAAGETSSASFRWIAQAGKHTVTAIADSHGSIGELDESNNELSVDYDATALADLIVGDASWEPARPLLAERVTIGFTVTNVGDGNSQTSEVRFYVDGYENEYDPSLLPGLAPGESQTFKFNWTAVLGRHTFDLEVDPGELVIETNETNNVSKTAVFDGVRLADLVMSGISWDPRNPSVGESVTFSVTVRNRGEANAGEFQVRLTDDQGSLVTKETVSGLRHQVSTTLKFTWTAEPGRRTFIAEADSGEVVTESDETNNESAPVEYDETALADLVVESITWDPASPSVGDSVRVSITIRNEGEGTARSSVVRFYTGGSESDSADIDVPSLRPGSRSSVSSSWTAKLGTHPFTAVADADGDVPESRETNNLLAEVYDSTLLSDLVVSDIKLQPDTPVAAQEVEIEVTIRNQGPGNASPFVVSLFIDGSSDPYDERGLQGILSGRREIITFTWVPGEGQRSIRVVLDRSGSVTEADKTNNEYGLSNIQVNDT